MSEYHSSWSVKPSPRVRALGTWIDDAHASFLLSAVSNEFAADHLDIGIDLCRGFGSVAGAMVGVASQWLPPNPFPARTASSRFFFPCRLMPGVYRYRIDEIFGGIEEVGIEVLVLLFEDGTIFGAHDVEPVFFAEPPS